jgi:selenocysteine lyase/cysteine desulfurase
MDPDISDAELAGYRAFGGMDDVALPAQGQGQGQGQASVSSGPAEERGQTSSAALRGDVLGGLKSFSGPYGARPCVYADWTASGRALAQVERYIQDEVLPLYGNTHTTTSITGNQSTCFRHESRQIIAEATNAKISGKAALDVVIFVGNGTTNAVTKLMHSLDLHLPNPGQADGDRPVVFTSCYEHHSNLLPWRESVAEVVTIDYSPVTGVCLDDLRGKLKLYASRSVKIGSFSAASNVSGVLTDVDAVSVAMHRAGGLAVFDYATAAPYVKVSETAELS